MEPLKPMVVLIAEDGAGHYAFRENGQVLCGAGPAIGPATVTDPCSACDTALAHTAVIRGEAPE